MYNFELTFYTAKSKLKSEQHEGQFTPQVRHWPLIPRPWEQGGADNKVGQPD